MREDDLFMPKVRGWQRGGTAAPSAGIEWRASMVESYSLHLPAPLVTGHLLQGARMGIVPI